MRDELESSSIAGEPEGGALETVSDAIGDLMTGVPAPIRRNAFKAFAQLCTAAIEVPVAHLEGIVAEKRAETAARVKLISTGASQISDQMDVDPEYARVAVKKFGQKIIRQQVNLDRISETAAEMLHTDTTEGNNTPEDSEKVISDDWLNSFQKEAEQVTSDEMRLLFGKVLAGEIKKPASFSIRTVKLLSQLDNQAAAIFQRFCSMCIAMRIGDQIIDTRVVALGGNAGSNSLQAYGMNFNSLNVLQEYGLIISDYNSWREYEICIANNNAVAVGFSHQNGIYGLVPLEGRTPSQEYKLYGVMLSTAGQELFKIVETIPVESYTAALGQFFESQQLMMVQIRESAVG